MLNYYSLSRYSNLTRDSISLLKISYHLNENIFSEANDLLRQMLCPDPNERITIPEVSFAFVPA